MPRSVDDDIAAFIKNENLGPSTVGQQKCSTFCSLSIQGARKEEGLIAAFGMTRELANEVDTPLRNNLNLA